MSTPRPTQRLVWTTEWPDGRVERMEWVLDDLYGYDIGVAPDYRDHVLAGEMHPVRHYTGRDSLRIVANRAERVIVEEDA